uniref:C-type lectin domain-containing protein n=1 Tax=Panagrolaimus sp. JU765 TaxID=591449 RepID=A0AC34PWE7_9BILA
MIIFILACFVNIVGSCVPNTPTTGVIPVCPSGWVSASFAATTYCYLYVEMSKTKNDAERYCNNVTPGGHLVSIHSSAENELVRSISSGRTYVATNPLNGQQTWIGLIRTSPATTSSPITFAWTDGTLMDYPTGPSYILNGGNAFPWDSIQPDNNGGNEFCGTIYTNIDSQPVTAGTWNDFTCTMRQPSFVCKVIAS